MYKRIFFQQEEDLENNGDSAIDLPILIYEENFIKKSVNWAK